jgi:5-methyltetrahydrofolate--homocysteine methyltransferase
MGFWILQMREDYYAGLEDRYFLTYEQAKENKLMIDFDAIPPAPAPKKLGISVIDDVLGTFHFSTT